MAVRRQQIASASALAWIGVAVTAAALTQFGHRPFAGSWQMGMIVVLILSLVGGTTGTTGGPIAFG